MAVHRDWCGRFRRLEWFEICWATKKDGEHCKNIGKLLWGGKSRKDWYLACGVRGHRKEVWARM